MMIILKLAILDILNNKKWLDDVPLLVVQIIFAIFTAQIKLIDLKCPKVILNLIQFPNKNRN